jgi:TonB family protein
MVARLHLLPLIAMKKRLTCRLLYLTAAFVSALSLLSTSSASSGTNGFSSNAFRPAPKLSETMLWHSPWQDELQFAFITQAVARARCEADQPPEALTTPNPWMDRGDDTMRIVVSFIVGTDGRVHSPFILESAGTSRDQTVLQAVQSWRYRPAMCNGVPTEVEAKIAFSKH